MLTALTLVLGTVHAQHFQPNVRSPEDEKSFQDKQYRRFVAENALEKCVKDQIELDVAMEYVGVVVAVNGSLKSCAILLEQLAFIDCAASYKDGEKYCSTAEIRAISIEVRRKRQLEHWIPILLKRRVELQPDGPRYLYDFASQFVYAVVAKSDKTGTTRQGSAVAVDGRYLVTNCHVIEKATEISIHSGSKTFGASRSGFASMKSGPDRCLLYSDEKLPSFAEIRDWRDLKVGERLYAIGVPQGLTLDLALTLSDGILSGKRTDGKHRLIQTTAPISQGSSGGGLFDSSGRLVGVTSFSLTNGQGLNFAIAAEDWRYELCEANQYFWGPTPDCARHDPMR